MKLKQVLVLDHADIRKMILSVMQAPPGHSFSVESIIPCSVEPGVFELEFKLAVEEMPDNVIPMQDVKVETKT